MKLRIDIGEVDRKLDPRRLAERLAETYRPMLEAGEVWMVGDNLEWDIFGAQSVGIFSVWNDYRRRGLREDAPAVPDRTIHALSELAD